MESPLSKRMNEKLYLFLFVLRFGLTLAIPIFTVVYICLYSDPAVITSGDKNMMAGSFFLVGLFIFWMQILFASYLPKTLGPALRVIFMPFLIMGIQYLFTNFSPALYLVDMGFVYVASIMLGFTILIFGGPIHSRGKWKKDWSEMLFGSCLQLIFIVPGALSIYVMGKFVFYTQVWTGSFDEITLFFGLVFLATILDNVYEFFHAIKDNSIYAAAKNTSRSPQEVVKNYMSKLIKEGEEAAKFYIEAKAKNHPEFNPYDYGEIKDFFDIVAEKPQHGKSKVSFKIKWRAEISSDFRVETRQLNTVESHGVWWITNL